MARLLNFSGTRVIDEAEGNKDWRHGLNSLSKLMGHVLSADLLANAVLSVGVDKTKIRVVKELLQALSFPLEQRLSLKAREQEDGLPLFVFKGVDPQPMKALLKFAYTHEWSWSGDIQDFASLLGLLKLVERFNVEILTQQIQMTIDSIIANETGFVNEKTVCLIFEHAHSFGVINLKNFALEIILRSFNAIFRDIENYRILTSNSFAEILRRDDVQVESEMELFNIVLLWGTTRCIDLEQDSTVENLGLILKNVLPCIRFTQMTLSQFMSQVKPTQLLSVAQMFDIQTILCSLEGATSQVKVMEPRRNYQSFKIIPGTRFSGSGYLKTAMTEIVYHVEEFGDSQKKELLSLVAPAKKTKHLLNLNIKLITEAKKLMSFLDLTSKYFLKINLNVDTINSLSVKSPSQKLQYLHVTTINFESFSQQSQLQCLTEIVQNSVNLRRLSLGNFSWICRSPRVSYSNLSTFLRLVTLKNLTFSCGLFGSPEVTLDLVKELENNFVGVKKIGFNFGFTDQTFEILEFLREQLEEIHYFDHPHSISNFRGSFDQLRILHICCESNVLANILQGTPNLKKLIWKTCCAAQLAKDGLDAIELSDLTSFVLFLNYEENIHEAGQMLKNCSKLDSLTCINFCGAPLRTIYEQFGRIKKFRVLQPGGVSTENIVGMDESLLEPRHLNHWDRNRPPFIGHLKELTTLSFGYKNYQHEDFVSTWALGIPAFTTGICHLTTLQKIIFPPMKLEQVKTIVDLLGVSSCLKQLKIIKFQIWFGSKEGEGEAMKMGQVKKLMEGNSKFKIEVVQIRPEDSVRYFWY